MNRKILPVQKRDIPSLIILFLLSLNLLILFPIVPSSAKPTNNGIVLESKWSWDEPNIDGNLDQLWAACPTYFYSILNYRDATNQTFSLKFLNTADFLFILVNWNDDYFHISDRISFYFDQENNGILDNSSEDAKAVSGLSPSLNDYFWDGNNWVSDTNQSMESGGAFQADQLELKIPIGVHAEDEDLNLISPGDIVGFGLIAIDGEFEDGFTGAWTTEIYGPANDSSNWADLHLAPLPLLDFPVILTPSSSLINVGEVFYTSGFVSNNNGTGMVYNLYATLSLPDEIELAPVTQLSQTIASLSVGQNHTFMWSLIAKKAGIYNIELRVDGTGIPTLTDNYVVTLITPFPEIYLRTPYYGESISGMTLFQFTILYQGTLIQADYSLNNQETWIDLFYNQTNTYYEALIDNRILSTNLYIRAIDNSGQITILYLQIFNYTISSSNLTQTYTIGDDPPVISLIDYCVLDDMIRINLQVSSPVVVSEVQYLLPDGTWLPTSFLIGIYSFQFQISTIPNNSIIKVRVTDEFAQTSYLNFIVYFGEEMISNETTIIVYNTSSVTTSISTTSIISISTFTTTMSLTSETTPLYTNDKTTDGSNGFIFGFEIFTIIFTIIIYLLSRHRLS
ncbi:MAG: hypothetical protein ACFFCQ_12840 [Promethearchaeota archaeon]